MATHPLILENGYSRAVVSGHWKLVLNLVPNSVREQAKANATKAQRKNDCISFYGDLVEADKYVYASPMLYPHYCDRTQLYDLSRDPAEQKNVYSEHPKVVQALTKLLWDQGCGTAQASCRVLKHRILNAHVGDRA